MKEKKTAKPGPTKKEIQQKIQESVITVIGDFKISNPSKKVKKTVKKASKALAKEVKHDLKSAKHRISKSSNKLNGKLVKPEVIA